MTADVQELHSLEAVARAGNSMASNFKEYGVAEIHPHFDIPPYLVGFRGEGGRAGLLLEVICNKVDRDEGLTTALLLAAMDCIAIAVTFDAHVATSDINPRTGKKWEEGEMQGLCDGEGACDTGLLTDCLMTTAVFATGKVAFYNHSYHFHEAKGEVAWVEEDYLVDLPDNAQPELQGYVPETLRDVMIEGRARSALLMESGLVQLPPHARAHRDAGILRALAERTAMIRISPEIADNHKERRIFHRMINETDGVHWMR